MTIKVFLLDDHEIVRRGLRELLEDTPGFEVVGESGLAQEAARRIPAIRPDVAVFDVRLPDGSGIEACRQVRSVDPSIAGLILTSFDDDQALATAVLAGASGFLLKDIKGNGLVEAIPRVAAGENLLDTARARRVRDSWRTGQETDPRLKALQSTRTPNPRPRGPRSDQPPDRGRHVAGREDRQELHHLGPVEAGDGAAHPSSRLRRDPPAARAHWLKALPPGAWDSSTQTRWLTTRSPGRPLLCARVVCASAPATSVAHPRG